jgi:hypothetical protein
MMPPVMSWKRLGSAAAVLIAGLMLVGPANAQSGGGSDAWPPPPETGAKVFDALVLRPLGFAGAVVGPVLFVPVAIVTAPGGKDTIEEALELFVLVPGNWVFTRPLGSF